MAVNSGIQLDELTADAVEFDVTSLITDSTDLIGLTQTQQVGEALANRHFGKNYQYINTAANISTTSGTFQNIQSLTTTDLPSGSYLFIFSGSFEKSLSAGKIETRFFLNASTELNLGHMALPDDDYRYIGQSSVVINLTGINTIAFQFRKSNGGGNIQVQNRTLFMFRVS